MKIVLIEAGDKRLINVFRAKLPREGLPILGKILEDLGHKVVIYVENIAPINWRDVLSSDLVGISALTPTAPRAYEIAKIIKTKGIPVIGGGPHFTFLPEEALRNGIDFVVGYEGEKTIVELVRWLEKPDPAAIGNILGLSFRIGRDIFNNPARPPIEGLDVIPFPKWSLINGFKVKGTIPVSTSRGCPHNCTFCSVTEMFGRKYRFRSVEKVIEELERLRSQFPKASLFFYDDNLAANPERLKILLREMIARKINFRWSAQVRVEVYKDPELLELMRESGCGWLYLGLESINPQTLIDFKKRQTVEDIKRGIETIHETGIQAVGMFIIGGDADDKKTAQRTIKFARECHIDAVIPWILSPLPGTQLYQQLDKERRLLKKDRGVKRWSDCDGFHVGHEPKKMKPWQLQISVNKALLNFYSFWNWVSKFWLATGKFFSPFHSLKEKKISRDNLGIAFYVRMLVLSTRRSLNRYAANLRRER